VHDELISYLGVFEKFTEKVVIRHSVAKGFG